MKTDFIHFTFFLGSALDAKKGYINMWWYRVDLVFATVVRQRMVPFYGCNHAVDFLTYWIANQLYVVQNSIVT